MKPEEQTVGQKSLSFRQLVFEALPEMWGFQILAAILLAIPASFLTRLIYAVAESGGAPITTANLRAFLLSWRFPAVLLLGALLVSCYIVVELFSLIHMSDDILNGRPAGIRRDIGAGIRSLRRFSTPAGLFVLLYIFIAVPLCGIGFSISLTETFYVPNFIMEFTQAKPLYHAAYAALILLLTWIGFSISLTENYYVPNFVMEFIQAKPLYHAAYAVLILLLLWIGYSSVFAVHAVLLDGMTPAEGRRASLRIVRRHGWKFLAAVLKLFVLMELVQAASYVLLCRLPGLLAARLGTELPHGVFLDLTRLSETVVLTETEASVVAYRVLCASIVLMGGYLNAVIVLLCGSWFMLRFTRLYLEYTREPVSSWPERPKKSRYRGKMLLMLAAFVFVILAALVIGLFYDQLIEREEPVSIIAHRAGGSMAPENSIKGLELAIERGCYGSEIDAQRTADGYYIVSHDNDFKRLTGVARAPQDMTLEEIRALRVRDTTGGAELSVVTLDEMLDVIKGREKLFIELKGASVDRRMVDDIVQMVREKDCVDDVALISLRYDVIDYAETTYPEFETGTLFFAGFGNVAKLNCDLLIMEEEMATAMRVEQIHLAGKQAVVWTVNTESAMRHFLHSRVDAIITDEIALAERVQAQLDERTELQVLQDSLSDFWKWM